MNITRTQTSALKGLAIVLIVMHNVIHILSPVKENEFEFIKAHVSTLLSALPHSPTESLFSFYGWLGVSVFVFISGYGLTVKYGYGKFNPYRWIASHYLRFILLMLPCYVLYIAYNHHLDPLNPIDYNLLLKQQLLLLNLHTPEAISPGVYWYLGMAIQLYAWFLLLRSLSSRWLGIITVACWAIIAFSPELMVTWLRHNSIGWMTEFTLGILFARYSSDTHISDHCETIYHGGNYPTTFSSWKSALFSATVCLALVFLSSLTRYTFTLSGAFFVLMLLPFSTLLSRSRILFYLGSISAALYLVHPLVRRVIVHYVHKFDIDIFPTFSALAVLLFSIACAHFYTLLLRQIR